MKLGRLEPSPGRHLADALVAVALTTVSLWAFSSLVSPWTALGWVALTFWLAAVDRARSSKEALALGVGLSVTFCATVFHWFPTALQGYSGAPRWLCWGAMLLLAPVFQPQFVLTALARHLARRAVGERAAWLPAVTSVLVYVGVEWLAPKLFSDTLGQGFVYSERLRQFGDVAGAAGLTLVLLAVNECLLGTVRVFRARGVARALRPLGVAVVLLMGLTGYGALRLSQVRAATDATPALVVGAVQANITNYEKLKAEMGAYEVVRTVLDTHYALSDALLREAPLDVLVWPETVYPTPFGVPKSEAGAELDAEIAGYVAARNVPLVFGSYDVEDGREFNAAMFLAPPTREGAAPERTVYRKSKLFPLTEWVPDTLDSPTLREWLPWTGRWTPGPGPRTLSLRRRDGRVLKVAPLICYDTVFPSHVAEQVRQGADLLVTLSNDSWFTGSPGPRMHLTHAIFRSIETRRPQVRVTNSGVSALIDASGEVLSEIADAQRGTQVMRVPASPGLSTLALTWGHWLGPVALVCAVALLGGAVLGARGSRR
ncbi:apolipoprotein N-acyltransferase [Myxococcus sp. K38C18041901]|uniref:apolipoprotein N-acyltransferase n=1 Tax=Myxococcus guangdongensis TaxID=2906760 RepID=UPI0020A80BE9|nr:apolipoprotein N-acyltransferase [Myxococcus guangdongensis]MCP3065694.1 apolipoprotein N-acyltransferase [Myxococcus guangdongensis]